MQAVRPSVREEAEEEPLALPQAQEVKEDVKGEVVKAKVPEEEVAPEEKAEAVVGEEKTEAEADEEAEAGASAKKNRIQVSTNKKPLYFYVNLAKRYMQTYDEVELSALGMAIGTVVTVAEILKNNGLATEKKILTSTIDTRDESKGRLVRKAKRTSTASCPARNQTARNPPTKRSRSDQPLFASLPVQRLTPCLRQ